MGEESSVLQDLKHLVAVASRCASWLEQAENVLVASGTLECYRDPLGTTLLEIKRSKRRLWRAKKWAERHVALIEANEARKRGDLH